MNHCVVTTINKPTKAIEKLHDLFGEGLIIVGDKKTPTDWEHNGVQPIVEHSKLYAPDNHYARKNLGYMLAIENGAEVIYESDDDNCPNDAWKIRNPQVVANESIGEGWVNVYSAFTDNKIWPRGFSLRNLNKLPLIGLSATRQSSIQQGVADGSPDVDAIWRLTMNQGIWFTHKVSIYLNPNTWCSFNSQSTWWFPKSYALMYLPITPTFRMTDIYRSFVGQRCLWELGEGVTFHSPSEVFQDRNEHDLLKDFEDEVHGYLNVDSIVEVLGKLELKPGEENVCNNLLTCYGAICANGILPSIEINSVKAWIKDYEDATRNL